MKSRWLPVLGNQAKLVIHSSVHSFNIYSVNNDSITLNIEQNHCPQRAYGLRKHTSVQEITTKGYNNFSFEKPWKHMSEGRCELSLKGSKG